MSTWNHHQGLVGFAHSFEKTQEIALDDTAGHPRRFFPSYGFLLAQESSAAVSRKNDLAKKF